MRALFCFRMLGRIPLTRQASADASTPEVLLNGVLGGLLQEALSGGIDSRGVARAMGGHDLALLPRVLMEYRLELRMDGALAAVGDDHRIELPPGFVEGEV